MKRNIEILILEDSKTQAAELIYILENNEYIVTHANNGEEALELLSNKLPDIIISDIVMPRINGFEFCSTVKSDVRLKNIPVILLTSLSDPDDIIKGLECGADSFITKPYNEDFLISKIQYLLMNFEFRREQSTDIGLEIIFKGKKHLISSSRLQIVDLLFSTYESAMQKSKELAIVNQELINTRDKLIQLNETLEQTVEFRTEELMLNNAWLQNENKERIHVEEDLRYSEERFKQVADTLGEWVWEVDAKGLFTYSSPVSELLLGYTPEELVQKKSFFDFFIPEQKEELKNAAFEVFAEKKDFKNFESSNTHKDGHVVILETHGKPVLDENGNLIGCRGSNLDITGRKTIEKELVLAKEKAEESDRLKTAFLHNISHEIRTPMNAILGFSDFLNNPDLDHEKRRDFIEIINQNSNQLLTIINDIISIATLEAGQEKIHEKECNLNSIFKLLREQFQFKANQQSLILKYEIPFSISDQNIKTDEIKLIHVLNSLISNALKFSKQGYISFGCSIEGDNLKFYVEDTGIGIAPEMHELIFNHFRQVENDNTREFGGSGLGLSIAKAYVELLGGKIWLTSELDKGSTFYFTIPYNKGDSKSLSEKQLTEMSSIEPEDPKTLLIAEDEDYNYMLLEEFLVGVNYTVIRAINGKEAVEKCKKNLAINLVLMDMKMPLMDGCEATKIIKELRPDLPVIAQTAYSTESDKERAFACGCTDFISKPFKRKEILLKIKEHL